MTWQYFRHVLCTAGAVGLIWLPLFQAYAEPPRILNAPERVQFRAALKAADRSRWQSAIRDAAKIPNPLALELIQWRYYQKRHDSVSFIDLKSFMEAHSEWPGMATLQRRAEEKLPDDMTDAAALTWFAAFPPASGAAKQRLGEALVAQGDPARGYALLQEAWIDGNFLAKDEKAFLRRHGALFSAEDHVRRLDRLLWDEQRAAARRMFGRVDKAHQHLAKARLALMERAGGVDATIKRVPAELSSDPGLIFERLRWRRRAGKDESARSLLRDLPPDLVRPGKWWREQNLQIREALDAGAITQAYRIAANHRQVAAGPVSEAEWLAGWIALRFLKEPTVAENHFRAMYQVVKYPISRSRGTYWAGRAAEDHGNQDLAREWYLLASGHPATFYGQLASQKLAQSRQNWPADPPQQSDIAPTFEANRLVKATRILGEVEDFDRLNIFLRHLSGQAETPTAHALIAQMGIDYGAPHLSIRIAKRASRSGVHLVANNYPQPFATPDLRSVPDAPELALLLGLARQESEMNPKAISRSGARGLMQLLPGTAKDMARKLGLPYKRSRLTEDPAYNIKLGSSYLAQVLEEFDGSYAMALAGYNAGPGRVRKWIKTYGDPRKGEIDPLDWIEMIPFCETRNYVQRVMESAQVYRQLLHGEADPMRIRIVEVTAP